MRSLYEPLLVDMDIIEGQLNEDHLQDRDFRYRSFVALAVYLLTGERQSGGTPQFPETVPEAAAAYARECMELTRRAGKTPSPAEFIDKFDSLLSAPTVDLATRLRGNVVAIEEMESAGSVSDFADDWNTNSSEQDDLARDEVSQIKRGIKTHDFNPLLDQRRGMPWGALAAAAAVILGVGAWMFMGSNSEVKPEVVVSSSAEGPSNTKVKPPQVDEKKTAVKQPVNIVDQNKTVSDQPAAPQPQKSPIAIPPTKFTPAVAVAVQNPLSQLSSGSPVAQGTEVGKPAMAKPVNVLPANATPSPTTVDSKPLTPTTSNPVVKQSNSDPITIRRAIVPSKEEIDRMKQGHVENRTGQMPALSTASPLPPKRKVNP